MKTTISLISQKATLHLQHYFFCTFLCRCFARRQLETSRNFRVTSFMEEMSYVFLFTFFSLPLIFTLVYVAVGISHFLTAAKKFSCASKKMSLFFISRSNSLSFFFDLVELRWPAALLSLFLCLSLSLSLHSKFVDMTINLSLIL